MRDILARTQRFLALPLDGVSRTLLVAAAATVIVVYVSPLWNMTMFAPQYPNGLRLDIYASHLEGGNAGNDVREINVLNHYIGMRDIAADDFTEFKWIPFVVGALALLFLRAAVHGTMANLVDVFVMTAYFGAFSIGSFVLRLYSYGHNLAPTAAVRVDPFMPPMFGYKQLANFEVYSYPGLGSYAIGVATLLLAAAIGRVWWRERAAGHGPATALAHA